VLRTGRILTLHPSEGRAKGANENSCVRPCSTNNLPLKRKTTVFIAKTIVFASERTL
jgi:hypothetical protein